MNQGTGTLATRWQQTVTRLLVQARTASPRRADGLPACSHQEELAGKIIALLAVTWIALVSFWGIAGPFPDGHFAATAGIGTAGYNMWVYKTIFPVVYIPVPPLTSGNYYMHHPLGDFWVAAVFIKLFGANNVAVRLPAVLYTIGSTILLYRLGRATWGALAGGLCALAFVSLPITVGFANFHALEGPVIFGCLLSGWAYARFIQTSRERYALLSVLGLLWAVNHDWIAYVWAGLWVTWLYLRGFVLPPRWFEPISLRTFARYWGLQCAVVVGSLVLIVALLLQTDKLPELLGMHGARAAGSGLPLRAVLDSRRVWISLMFSDLAIVMGKIALPVLLIRLVATRNELEILPLLILTMATVQYVHFKQGADIHIFWPQYYAPYFALGVGALTATARAGADLIADAFSGTTAQWVRRNAAWLGLGTIGLLVLFVFHDGAATVRLARETGGRFVSSDIRSDVDTVEAVDWLIAHSPPAPRIAFHPGIEPVHWALCWEFRPHVLIPRQPVVSTDARDRLYVMDSRYAPVSDLKLAASKYHVRIIGHHWLIDRGQPAGPVDGYRFDEREPSLLQSFLRGATEPIRTVQADPFATWEWRSLLGQPAIAPTEPPRTLDQIRIAHNAALAAGNTAEVARFKGLLDAALTYRQPTVFDNGTELIGLYHHRGAQRSVTVFFRAGHFSGRAKFAIYAKVEKPPRFSSLPQDPAEISIAPPPPVPTELWKPGHIYSVQVPYRKRPGQELLTGAFVPLDGHPAPAVQSKSKGKTNRVELIRL
ncbi:MAG: hypothetical protein QOI66_3905 [Myxococcales bacterium]|jgi:4-amino-4-deoxy-L-arabinose transferase-like glycosyltransferase|nr:hypothetical protein [Myxococcales bacterium]